MTLFLSAYTNGVDKKGRVSVPAAFRAELSPHSRQQVVAYVAPEGGYLYVWGYDDFMKFAETIKKMPPMSPQRQRLARSILAAARPLGFDSEGRVMLPEPFLEAAGITERAVFSGEGEYFTLWSPEAYTTRQQEDAGYFEEDLNELTAAWSQQHG